MKKVLIFTVMLLSILVLGYAQSALSGTYRYDTSYYITFTGNNFTGAYGSFTMSGTYSVSGNRLTINITGGTQARNTWNWTIVDMNTLKDTDGDNWKRNSDSSQVPAVKPSQSVAQQPVQAQTEADFQFSANSAGTGLIITGYNWRLKDVVIPATIQGYPVIEIGNGAFENTWEDFLTSVVIPRGVTIIGREAFCRQSKLNTNTNTITIPEGVTTIRRRAFFDCHNLKTVNLPSTIRIIESGAFSYCNITTLNIPESVKRIDFAQVRVDNPLFGERSIYDAFYGNSQLPIPTQMRLRQLGYKGEF